MKVYRHEPSRLKILQEIFNDFQQITQWLPEHLSSALQYKNEAEGLIKRLEVEDCGYTGGFDENGNEIKKVTGYHLYDRFFYVLEKYHTSEYIKPCCGFTVKSLGKYFKTIKELRGKS